MKKLIVALVAAFALSLVTAAYARDYKMTDEKYARFMKTDADFKNAQDKLNAVWKQLKGTLGKEEFDKLLKEQRLWIRQQGKLAGAINGVSEVEAFTLITQQRTKELDKMLAGHSGKKQVKNRRDAQEVKSSSSPKNIAEKKLCGVFGEAYSENGRFLAYELMSGKTRVFISGYDEKVLDQIDALGIEPGDKVCATGTINDNAYDMSRAFFLVKQQ